MPKPAASSLSPVVFVWGEDEFTVKQRAREIYQQWSAELGGQDHETIDAAVNNSGEALKALAKLREALQTLPFFGSGKAVWFQNCNFLGDERAATAQAVTESLAELAQELKAFSWKDVRLLISAGKVDKRKTFYKALEKIGTVENHAGLSVDDRDWAGQAEAIARREFKARGKSISDTAVSELVAGVGPNVRQLNNEVEKVALFAGDRAEIEVGDVTAVVSRNKQARAFALGDALGDRDLPRLLRCLDEELWEMKFDRRKSEIGLLYGLISKVRAMIFLKEMMRAGWLKADGDYPRFKDRLARIPREALPEDKRFNPLAINPYVLFKALPQTRHYSLAELIRAMDLLLQCNQQLIFSNQDEAMVLQRTLVQIVGGADDQPDQRAA
ncbi:MAG TPA: DNA polymerase III subunit delta [Haliangiales bacterium]|nr:DNA polymerase III subunit delta [Haliangiales bacterium]